MLVMSKVDCSFCGGNLVLYSKLLVQENKFFK